MPDYATMTKEDLYELAQELEIEGRSQMDKSELAEAVAKSADGGSRRDGLDRSPTSSRTIWRGAINFGLITIPVGLYTAVEDRDVSFHLLDHEDGSRVRNQRINQSTGEVIEWDDIVRGYEYEPDRYVTFTHEELDQLQPESSRVIDVNRFVQEEEVDALYLERSYYLAPDETAVKPYRLLASALEASDRVGIAKVSIRQKEKLCMIRPRDGLLVLETMHWPDELRIPAFEELETGVDISPEELDMAQSLIDQLGGDFEPERYQDEFRERVEEAVQDKIEGEDIKVPPPPEPEGAQVTDLLEALRASVDQAREKRSA